MKQCFCELSSGSWFEVPRKKEKQTKHHFELKERMMGWDRTEKYRKIYTQNYLESQTDQHFLDPPAFSMNKEC